MRILVIEEDLMMAHFLKEILASLFPGCETGGTYRQESEALLKEGWDIVVHGMSARQNSAMFLQKIKRRYPSIMTVLVMGILGRDDNANLIVDYVWESPFDHNPLKEAVKIFFG